ncbi:MAG: hypothetical protein HY319_29290 [Armatimonadetes bacterium]|nr:hypothetical protein [Armatimonadota bacterium]
MNVTRPGDRTLLDPHLHGRFTLLSEGRSLCHRISGDGRAAVWSEQTYRGWEIMLYHDGEVTQLTHDDRFDWSPDISADGHTVSWYREVDDKHYEIVRWHDGKSDVIASSELPVAEVRLSRDGETVVYGDGRGTNYNQLHCWHEGRLSAVSERPGAVDAELSADGSRIFWSQYQPGSSGIFMRDENGRVKQLAVDEPHHERRIEVDPTGSKVMWSHFDGSERDLQLMDVDSGNSRTVGKAGVHEFWGSMSADGKTVAYARYGPARRDQDLDLHVFLEGPGRSIQVTRGKAVHTAPELSDGGDVLLWRALPDAQHPAGALYRLELDSTTESGQTAGRPPGG